MACKPRLEGEVIRTSGFCWICDSWFTDTWVLHYRARAATGGWAFCECWHLIEQEVLPWLSLTRANNVHSTAAALELTGG